MPRFSDRTLEWWKRIRDGNLTRTLPLPPRPVAPSGPINNGPGPSGGVVTPGGPQAPGYGPGASAFSGVKFPMWVYSGAEGTGPVHAPYGETPSPDWNQIFGYASAPTAPDPPVNGVCKSGSYLSADKKSCIATGQPDPSAPITPPGGGPKTCGPGMVLSADGTFCLPAIQNPPGGGGGGTGGGGGEGGGGAGGGGHIPLPTGVTPAPKAASSVTTLPDGTKIANLGAKKPASATATVAPSDDTVGSPVPFSHTGTHGEDTAGKIYDPFTGQYDALANIEAKHGGQMSGKPGTIGHDSASGAGYGAHSYTVIGSDGTPYPIGGQGAGWAPRPSDPVAAAMYDQLKSDPRNTMDRYFNPTKYDGQSSEAGGGVAPPPPPQVAPPRTATSVVPNASPSAAKAPTPTPALASLGVPGASARPAGGVNDNGFSSFGKLIDDLVKRFGGGGQFDSGVDVPSLDAGPQGKKGGKSGSGAFDSTGFFG